MSFHPIPTPTILVVDDQPLAAQAIARVVHDAGYNTKVAHSMDEAMSVLNNAKIDGLVTDVQMPNGSGVELLGAVRAVDPFFPVVLLSAEPDADVAMEALNLHASGFLTKPVERSVLARMLERALARAHDERTHRAVSEVERERTLTSAKRRQRSEDLFAEALLALDVHFQPIVNWDAQRVEAYEALVRCPLEPLRAPPRLFALARDLGRCQELSRRIRKIAVDRFADEAPPSASLFLNLAPEDFADPMLYSTSGPFARLARRCVLEISEQVRLDAEMKRSLRKLRRAGFRVAVDDVGAGYAGLNRIAEITPDVIKLDMAIVRDIHKTPLKQRLVRALAVVARDGDIDVVAEGVENEEELLSLGVLGADLIQGYYLARPSREFVDPLAPPEDADAEDDMVGEAVA